MSMRTLSTNGLQLSARGTPHPALRATFSPQAGRRPPRWFPRPACGERVAEGRVRGEFGRMAPLIRRFAAPSPRARGEGHKARRLGAGDADAAEWIAVDGVGFVWRRIDGPALFVSPFPVTEAMK